MPSYLYLDQHLSGCLINSRFPIITDVVITLITRMQWACSTIWFWSHVEYVDIDQKNAEDWLGRVFWLLRGNFSGLGRKMARVTEWPYLRNMRDALLESSFNLFGHHCYSMPGIKILHFRPKCMGHLYLVEDQVWIVWIRPNVQSPSLE